MRSPEDAEQRLAEVRAYAAVDNSSKNGTSSAKDSELDDEHKEHDGHNADDSQDPRNRGRSLLIEKLSILLQCDKNKSNKTSVFSKTSRTRRVLNWS